MNDNTLINNLSSINDTIKLEGNNLVDNTLKIIVETQDSNSDISLLITIVVPLIIAFIGGFFALKQVKKNVLLNSRMKWIEDFRHIISQYLATVSLNSSNITNMIKYKNELETIDERKQKTQPFSKECEKVLKEAKSNYLEWYSLYLNSNGELNILLNKVVLYLSLNKKEHKRLITKIEEIDGYFNPDNLEDVNCEKLKPHVKEAKELSRLIIEKELNKN